MKDFTSTGSRDGAGGVAVVNWYVRIGVGQVVTLRSPASRLHEVNRVIELRLQAIGFARQLSVGSRPAQFFRQNPQIFGATAAQQSREFIGIEGGLRKGWRFALAPTLPGPLEETLEHLHFLEPRLRACAIKSRAAPLVPLAEPSTERSVSSSTAYQRARLGVWP